MTSKLQELNKQGLIFPPKFVLNNTIYETIIGSIAYGISGESSDIDIYGFCIPSKEIIFPHLNGEIEGFGVIKKKFEQYQKHHINYKDKKYDITVYNIIKFFNLTMNCNPNMIDTLYTPIRCVLHLAPSAQIVRDNRDLFLSKKAWYTFKGYAYSQMSKIKRGANKLNPIRQEYLDKFGYDIKFAYHVVRLMEEVIQILNEHTLDLERNQEILKSIRNGEWTLKKLQSYFESYELILQRAYEKSSLREIPDERSIKNVLLQCLENHYGNLSTMIHIPDKFEQFYYEIQKLSEKYA